MTEERLKRSGYEIIKTVKLPDTEYELCTVIDKDNIYYVTYEKICGEYHHGNYSTNYEDALINFYKRIKIDIEMKIDSLEAPF